MVPMAIHGQFVVALHLQWICSSSPRKRSQTLMAAAFDDVLGKYGERPIGH
jgi:hypothetical protein